MNTYLNLKCRTDGHKKQLNTKKISKNVKITKKMIMFEIIGKQTTLERI